jgi:hypothetical protein
MAKKRSEKPEMPATANEPKTKPVRLDLPPDVHRLLRLVAADEEMSMASYARELLEKHLRDEAKRRGIKG